MTAWLTNRRSSCRPLRLRASIKPAGGGHTKSRKSAPLKSTATAGPAGKTKTCSDCRKTKPLGEFGKNKHCRDGCTGTCKECIAIRAREYYAKRHGKPLPQPDSPENSGELDDADDDEGVPCPLCKARCSSEGRLQSHMRSVHGKAM